MFIVLHTDLKVHTINVTHSIQEVVRHHKNGTVTTCCQMPCCLHTSGDNDSNITKSRRQQPTMYITLKQPSSYSHISPIAFILSTHALASTLGLIAQFKPCGIHCKSNTACIDTKSNLYLPSSLSTDPSYLIRPFVFMRYTTDAYLKRTFSR